MSSCELIVERCDSGAFRLIWLERDEETGARSVCDIIEVQCKKEVPYWSTRHGELSAEQIRAPWKYDVGKATRTRSVVKKIVEQWSDPAHENHEPDQDTTESLTVSEALGPTVPVTITVAPSLTPLEAATRLKDEKSFSRDGWDYEWDDDSKSPFARARVRIGTDPTEEGTWHEFYPNGAVEDPIDENSFWVLV
jgi:hypothetical protein